MYDVSNFEFEIFFLMGLIHIYKGCLDLLEID